MSDSLNLNVTGEGRDRLVKALELAPIDSITGVIWKDQVLHLVHEHDHRQPQKMTFSPVLMVDVVIDWLARQSGSNSSYASPVWPKQPDIDGDCKKGWLLEADRQKIIVRPHWMIYHV
jgi:hypothetical protein